MELNVNLTNGIQFCRNSVWLQNE